MVGDLDRQIQRDRLLADGKIHDEVKIARHTEFLVEGIFPVAGNFVRRGVIARSGPAGIRIASG